MLLRTAEETDYPEIIKIYNHAVDEKFATADTEYITIESRKEWFAQHSPKTYPIYVAEENSQVIGWCSLSPTQTRKKSIKNSCGNQLLYTQRS